MSRKIPTVLLIRISARFFSRLVYLGKRQRSPPERKALFPKFAEQLNFFIEPILRRPNGPKLGLPSAFEGHQREENLDASPRQTPRPKVSPKGAPFDIGNLAALGPEGLLRAQPSGGRLRGRLAFSALLRPRGAKQRGVRPRLGLVGRSSADGEALGQLNETNPLVRSPIPKRRSG